MDFQSEKSFGKLRLRAFQPYHQILCMLKHVKDVKDYLRHALIYTVLFFDVFRWFFLGGLSLHLNI